MASSRFILGLGLSCLVGAGTAGAAQSISSPVQCHASGTKLFAPAMVDGDACARFVRALGAAARTSALLRTDAPREGLVVELSFLPRGLASAKVTQMRAGRARPSTVYQLAVSDRQFAARDIDSLAADVARGIMLGTKRKREG